jgi:hypothetical protein
MRFKRLGLLLLLVFPLLGMLGSAVSPPQASLGGYCEVVNGRLNGVCLGRLGLTCRQAYDPAGCRIGSQARRWGLLCRRAVDPFMACRID